MKLLLLTCLLISQNSFAFQNKYLTNRLMELNVIKKIGPYPEKGSAAYERDFQILKDYQNNRTPEQCENAAYESNVDLYKFFAGKFGPLTTAEIDRVKKHLRIPLAKVGVDILITKKYFNRPRPYLANSEIKPCIELEKSKAYPSGHAALSRTYANVLAKFYPEKKDLLIARANQIAINRVLGGVHHPSDIEAGIKLGNLIAKNLIESREFVDGLNDFLAE